MDALNYFLMHTWLGIIEFQFLNVENQYFITNVASTQILQNIMKVNLKKNYT
jgi:hypothetical protein